MCRSNDLTTDYLSDCCNTASISRCGDEGTCHAECSNCGKPCNLTRNQPDAKAYATQLLQRVLDEMPKADTFDPHSVKDEDVRNTNNGYKWGHNEYRGKTRQTILTIAESEGLSVKEK